MKYKIRKRFLNKSGQKCQKQHKFQQSTPFIVQSAVSKRLDDFQITQSGKIGFD